MGFFTVVALILIAAKAFGFLAIGWAWCFAPILVDVALVALLAGAGLFAAKKAVRAFNDAEPRGLTNFDHDVIDRVKDRHG